MDVWRVGGQERKHNGEGKKYIDSGRNMGVNFRTLAREGASIFGTLHTRN